MSISKKSFLKLIKISYIFIFSFFILGFDFAGAQSKIGLPDFSDIGKFFLDFNKNIVQNLVILLSGVAVVLFLFGLVRFIYDRSRGDTKSLADDRNNILWSLGALFILVSLWGVIRLAQDILQLDKDNDIKVPRICVNGSCDGSNSKLPDQGNGSNNGAGFINKVIDKLDTKTLSSTTKKAILCPDGNMQVIDLSDCTKTFKCPDGKMVLFDTDCLSYEDIDVGTSDLYVGSNGDYVSNLQDFLDSKECFNYSNGDYTRGEFDKITERALKEFQEKNGISGTGILYSSTRRLIYAGEYKSCK